MTTLEEIFKDAIDGKPFDELDPELADYMYDTGDLGTWIKHPLVYAPFYSPALHRLYNEQLRMKREALARAEEEKDWNSYIYLHERPYRVAAFQAIQHRIGDGTYWKLLGSIWRDSENIRENHEEWIGLISSPRARREEMMNDEDRKALEAMPLAFTIYQGHTDKRDDGYSWTTAPETAAWFANRFADMEKARPMVTTAVVAKRDVIAYMTDRNEFEILVSPEVLTAKKTRSVR